MEIRFLDESDFSKAINTDKPVLIDFYAAWCDSCRTLDPIIYEFAQENPQVDVYKLNVDDNMDIANLYGIMSVPTVMVMEDKKVKNRVTGSITKEDIEELLQ